MTFKIEAASEELPQATIVIDLFHIARYYRNAVDSLRKQEVRRLKQELPKDEQLFLYKTLWPMRKAPADLSDYECAPWWAARTQSCAHASASVA